MFTIPELFDSFDVVAADDLLRVTFRWGGTLAAAVVVASFADVARIVERVAAYDADAAADRTVRGLSIPRLPAF